jgi:hypothetical protein
MPIVRPRFRAQFGMMPCTSQPMACVNATYPMPLTHCSPCQISALTRMRRKISRLTPNIAEMKRPYIECRWQGPEPSPELTNLDLNYSIFAVPHVTCRIAVATYRVATYRDSPVARLIIDQAYKGFIVGCVIILLLCPFRLKFCQRTTGPTQSEMTASTRTSTYFVFSGLLLQIPVVRQTALLQPPRAPATLVP